MAAPGRLRVRQHERAVWRAILREARRLVIGRSDFGKETHGDEKRGDARVGRRQGVCEIVGESA